MIAFKIEDKTLRAEFHKYFNMQIWHWKTDYNANTYFYYDIIHAEPCTKDHFLIDDIEDYDDFGIDKALCMPKDYEMEITRNKGIESAINIGLTFCDKDERDDCIDLKIDANKKKFSETYKSFYMDIFQVNFLNLDCTHFRLTYQ